MKGKRKMSIYFAVEFDNKTIQKLKQKQLIIKQNCKQGDFVQPETFHITILFGVGGDSHNARSDYIKVLDEFGRRFKNKYKPFNIKLQNFGQFPNGGEEGNVVWIGVRDSFPLYQIKKDLEKVIEDMGVKKEKSQFPNYIPHITMAYNCILNEGFQTQFEDDEPITIKSICLWDSFKTNDTYIYNKVHELFL